ncbi:aminotransferase class I/II-fold pyridoxal phosphate-dependent enzyme, partial [Agrococcus terreus]
MTNQQEHAKTTALEALPLRANLRGQSPYGAPQLEVEHLLNTNENTHPVPQVVVDAIASAVHEAAVSLNRYPDREFTQLRQRLAAYLGHGLTEENMWAANGSNEVLQQILQAFGGPGRKLLSFPPTYSMYPLLASGTNTEYIAGVRNEDFTLSPESAARQVQETQPNVVFLCSPNN